MIILVNLLLLGLTWAVNSLEWGFFIRTMFYFGVGEAFSLLRIGSIDLFAFIFFKQLGG